MMSRQMVNGINLKTRVWLDNSKKNSLFFPIVLHVLNYNGIEIDYITESETHLTQQNDFVIFNKNINEPIKPNIALLCGMVQNFSQPEKNREATQEFINNIVKGGILVYNDEDEALRTLVADNTNTIRKHPYSIPIYKIEKGITFLQTPEGNMPVALEGKQQLIDMAGTKWICQHLGVDEDAFYEALGAFRET